MMQIISVLVSDVTCWEKNQVWFLDRNYQHLHVKLKQQDFQKSFCVNIMNEYQKRCLDGRDGLDAEGVEGRGKVKRGLQYIKFEYYLYHLKVIFTYISQVWFGTIMTFFKQIFFPYPSKRFRNNFFFIFLPADY